MLKPIDLDMLSAEQLKMVEQYLENFEVDEHAYVYRAGDIAELPPWP